MTERQGVALPDSQSFRSNFGFQDKRPAMVAGRSPAPTGRNKPARGRAPGGGGHPRDRSPVGASQPSHHEQAGKIAPNPGFSSLSGCPQSPSTDCPSLLRPPLTRSEISLSVQPKNGGFPHVRPCGGVQRVTSPAPQSIEMQIAEGTCRARSNDLPMPWSVSEQPRRVDASHAAAQARIAAACSLADAPP